MAPLLTCFHDVSYPLLKITGIDLGHRQITHSLVLAIPVAFLVGALFHYLYGKFKMGFCFGIICFCSHLIMDMGASLTGPMIFYPFSEARVDFPFHFMPVAEPRIGSLKFNSICILYEFLIFGSIMFLMLKRQRVVASLILCFLMLGSIRQSNFRGYIWLEAPEDELEEYLENLDSYSPWHFSTFSEGFGANRGF